MYVCEHCGSGSFVQIVDVLRGDVHLRMLLPLRDGAVAGVGFGTTNQCCTPPVPTPHEVAVGEPALGTGEVLRIEVLLQTGPGVAKRCNSGFGRHAGPGQNDDARCRSCGVHDGLWNGVDRLLVRMGHTAIVPTGVRSRATVWA